MVGETIKDLGNLEKYLETFQDKNDYRQSIKTNLLEYSQNAN